MNDRALARPYDPWLPNEMKADQYCSYGDFLGWVALITTAFPFKKDNILRQNIKCTKNLLTFGLYSLSASHKLY